MAMYAKVRRLRLRDGLSISEIARPTSLSRNTIKTWLRTPVRSEMQYRRSPAPKKIGPYEAVLRDALAADARRPRRERRTARRLYAQLQAQSRRVRSRSGARTDRGHIVVLRVAFAARALMG